MTRMDEQQDRQLRTLLVRAGGDAPRVDLWPRLEGAVTALAAEQARRRRRSTPLRRFLTLAAASLSLALTLTTVLIAGSLLGGPAPATMTGGTLPDTMLLFTAESSRLPAVYRVASQRAGSRTPQPVVDSAAGLPVIAPDGRVLVFSQVEQTGREVRFWLAAVAADSLAPLWRVPVTTQPLVEPGPYQSEALPLPLGVVVTADRVYVASGRLGAGDPIIIQALDRTDGREQTRWSVDGGPVLHQFALVGAPDGSELYLFTYSLASLQAGKPAQELFFRLRPAAGHLERQELSTAQAMTDFLFNPEARVTPDGRSLYVLADRQVSFFDLPGGAVQPPLTLPFSVQPDEHTAYQTATTPDGQTLYLFDADMSEVVAVDLRARTANASVRLRAQRGRVGQAPSPAEQALTALRRLVIEEALAKEYYAGSMQVSPDGRRLYAIGRTGVGEGARRTGVLVIDTHDWRVSAHWLPAAAPSRLLLSGDGRTLYVQEHEWGEAGVTAGRLRALDTANGREFAVLDTGTAGAYILAEIYRTRYGTSK